MAKKYKRKFLVSGDTPLHCEDFCRKIEFHERPCIKDVAKRLGRTYNLWNSLKEMQKCPHRGKLGKPRQYIVSETTTGDWECSCPVWKFRRKECKHIKKVKANPEKYEISKEFTGGTTNLFSEIFKS